MRIAFYAPLKPPDHPVPSGDRRIGQLFLQALAGHSVSLVSRFRSWDRHGDVERQAHLQRLGVALAERLLRRWDRSGQAPQLWFTYHLYHKAPDWLGPVIACRLGIPYVIAEASIADKRRDGPWALGWQAARDAICQADRVLTLNSDDYAGLLRHRPAAGVVRLAPFLDAAPWRAVRRAPTEDVPLLLAVGMMRPGDKLASYLLLAQALRPLIDQPWRLRVIGDGPAGDAVRAAFAPFGERVEFCGAVAPSILPLLVAPADVMVWPAINEAFGMALLEAQAAGVPVVAGGGRGVGDIVQDGITGLTPAIGDVAAFTAALAGLLTDPPRRRSMARQAALAIDAGHDLPQASARLDALLRELVP